MAVLGGTTTEPAVNSLALGSAKDNSGNLVASETTAENSIAVLGGTTASQSRWAEQLMLMATMCAVKQRAKIQ